MNQHPTNADQYRHLDNRGPASRTSAWRAPMKRFTSPPDAPIPPPQPESGQACVRRATGEVFVVTRWTPAVIGQPFSRCHNTHTRYGTRQWSDFSSPAVSA
ncbi:hypothetical protein KCP75_22860 [Salmonella enterica subsp. enterica]|nr:hypothetical protein KCP75_22860 [Salmonella enterica subsp. enterica]